MTMVRGIRNNNPGNIDRNTTKWLGMADKQTDARFIVFKEMKYGCRAILKLLSTYYNKYNLYTVKDIISRWAPSTENDTSAYYKKVAKDLGVDPKEKLIFTKDIYIALGKAITFYECGSEANSISDYTWEEAYKLL